jgi:hypothetical protein
LLQGGIVAIRNRVVARFMDGRVLKGTTQDFIPTRSFFHVITDDDKSGVQVRIEDLKAVFFVKDVKGNPDRVDVPAFMRGASENAYGKKIAVRFPDGEVICGYSLSYSSERSGFFMATMDPRGNNERLFVVLTPGVDVFEGQAAEELVKTWKGNAAA